MPLISQVLGFSISLLTFWVAGIALLRVLRPAQAGFSRGERLLLTFALGNGAVVLEMFAFSVADVPLLPWTVLLPWVAIGAGMLCVGRKRRRSPQAEESVDLFADHSDTLATRRNSHRWLAPSAAIVIAIGVGDLLMRVLTSPFISGDAIFFWTPKAKIFFAHQLAPSLSFGDLGEFFHADYPLFVPLTEAWTFICVGRADEYLMKLLFPLYAILLVVGVWVVTARFAGRCAGWIAAALLATTPVLLWQGTAAMADLPLALYGWLATAMLLRWCVEGERRFLVLCALFAGMTGWIKNEGLALIVVTGCLVALHLATQRRSAIGRRMGDMLLFAAVAAAVILPWLVVRACCGLEADLHMPRAGSFWSLVEARWRSIGSALAGRLFSPAGVSGTWNLAWYLLMGVILVHASALLRSPLRYPALLIVGQVAVYTGVYFITPHDVDWQLATSLDRLFLHVYPQALLLVGWGMRGIVEGRPESATADVRGAG